METFELPKNYGHEILRCEVGSTLHGTGLEGAEDLDLMGIYLEWPDSTVGLASKPHYSYRTAGEGKRSTADDTDVICYSAKKWVNLALKGNPSVLVMLYAPVDKVKVVDHFGEELRKNAQWFSSRKAGKAFLGYMTQQRQRMTGERGRAGRVRKTHDGEFDTKYSMHMLRLGFQGVEFLETGKLTLPVPGDIGDWLRDVRKGNVSLPAIIAAAEDLEAQVKDLLNGKSPLPEEADHDAAEKWLIDSHFCMWSEKL